ncbi:5-methylcytosine-specific restriction protein A [Nitrobacteraceae bacterium AZCC 1564]
MSRLPVFRTKIPSFDTRRAKPPAKVADPELLTPEHKAWRLAVCRRAGWRCEWVEDGKRCTKRAPQDRVVADHVIERADGGALYDLSNGQCLCVAHNTLKGLKARGARAASS